MHVTSTYFNKHILFKKKEKNESQFIYLAI